MEQDQDKESREKIQRKAQGTLKAQSAREHDRSPGMTSNTSQPARLSGRPSQIKSQADNDNRSLDQIEEDIRARRRALVKTVHIIQERLKMQNLTEEIMESAKDLLSHSSDRIVSTVKQHPLPAALIGAGLGWLVYEITSSNSLAFRRARMGRVPSSRGSYMYGPESEALYPRDEYGFEEEDEEEPQMGGGRMFKGSEANGSRAGVFKRLRQRAFDVRSGSSHLKDELKNKRRYFSERAHEIGDYAKERARGARESLRHSRQVADESVREHPMMSGLLGLALGVTLGFLIPESRKERRLLGKTREKLIKRARDLGSETVEKARQNFEEVKGEVKETLSKTEEKSSQQGAKDKPASSQETGRKVL